MGIQVEYMAWNKVMCTPVPAKTQALSRGITGNHNAGEDSRIVNQLSTRHSVPPVMLILRHFC